MEQGKTFCTCGVIPQEWSGVDVFTGSHYSVMRLCWIFNALTVHVSVCGGRGLSLRTLAKQISPSGRASTGESLLWKWSHVTLCHETHKKSKNRRNKKHQARHNNREGVQFRVRHLTITLAVTGRRPRLGVTVPTSWLQEPPTDSCRRKSQELRGSEGSVSGSRMGDFRVALRVMVVALRFRYYKRVNIHLSCAVLCSLIIMVFYSRWRWPGSIDHHCTNLVKRRVLLCASCIGLKRSFRHISSKKNNLRQLVTGNWCACLRFLSTKATATVEATATARWFAAIGSAMHAFDNHYRTAFSRIPDSGNECRTTFSGPWILTASTGPLFWPIQSFATTGKRPRDRLS